MRKNYTSEPKGRKFISVTAFFLTIILIGLLNILRRYAIDKFPQYIPDTPALPVRLITALMIISAALYVIFIVLLLPMWYKSIRYTINDREVVSYSGIFSRTYRIMKVDSVQHAVRVSLPMSRITSFNFIILRALGGTMPMMFLSDKDCSEILEFFRMRCEMPVSQSSKYSVEYSAQGNKYVYTDNASILSPEEISAIAGDFDSVTQMTFDDVSSGQLSFNDIDNKDK